MSKLKLTIEALKHPVPKGATEEIKFEYSPTDWQIFLILEDFLQPGNATSTSDVAGRISKIFANNPYGVRAINSVCLELVEQIPYNCPSQLKLVRLLWLVGRNEKRIQHHDTKSKSKVFDSFYQHLSEDIADNKIYPGDDESSSSRYINFQSFLGNLMDAGLWIPSAGGALSAMRNAFEQDHSTDGNDAEDARIMGAAQWILTFGQGLYKLILLPDGDDVEKLTIETWRTWKTGFGETLSSDRAGNECKHVAARALQLMEAIEWSMGCEGGSG